MDLEKNQFKKLTYLDPREIDKNPENPRIIFRQEELDDLLISIDKHGIQVPITVYLDKGKYFLVDGERRWRCALKLNLKKIPALIQSKPSELENLLLMYNIHALREQWDYFTIASKLERVIALIKRGEGIEPGEKELSEATGLTRGAIRRCLLLINLPPRYRELLLTELEKPKDKQKLSEDLFIELEKSLKTVIRRVPTYENSIDQIRDVLIGKYKKGTISAITDFRQLSKIATAVDRFGVSEKRATRILGRLFDAHNDFSIKQAYKEAVEFEYDEDKARKSIVYVTTFLDEVVEHSRADKLSSDMLENLKELYAAIRKVIR